MRAAILCIGTELIRGEIDNTNATWLATELTRLGAEVGSIEVVGDDRALIARAVERLAASHDVVVSTGGLGPTTDDLTSPSVAVALGVPLERDRRSLEAIAARMARRGRAMAPSNEKQADVPRGAVVLPNDWGTAPGFAVTLGPARLFFLPGVPREMKPMFERSVEPWISDHIQTVTVQVRLKTYGAPESTVNDLLHGIEAEHGVTLGYRAHFPEIEVKILARSAERAEAAERARQAADQVRTRLGSLVYGEGTCTFAEAIGKLLRGRGLVLGVAESCTGGLLGALLTDAAGSSDFFAGGVISYANAVKTSLLGVDPATLAERGAVSREVAEQMARGARHALGVDVAVSITGVAGPGGGTAEKPVGLVWLAVCTAEGTTATHINHPAPRDMVRRRAAFAALSLVRDVLTQGQRPV